MVEIACPFCQHDDAKKIRFTAWGGVVGPRLMSLVKCVGCGEHYNGRSGKCVKRAILVYTTVMVFVLIGLVAGIMIATFGPSPKGSEQAKRAAMISHRDL